MVARGACCTASVFVNPFGAKVTLNSTDSKLQKVLFYETFSVLGKLFLRSPNLQGMSILVIALEHCKVKGLVRQVKSPLF